MLSFEKIFSNWFADIELSFDDLEAGTRDHLERLRKGNEKDRFADLIKATEACYTAYFGRRSQSATASSTGKGTTLTLHEAMEAMTDWLVGEGQEAIYYKLKKEADRLRFFPRGNSEYHQARHGEWPGLLERLDTAFEDLGGPFEAEVKAAYKRHRDALLLALATQSGVKKQQADASVGSAAERALLTRQLSRNARTLGLVFDEQPREAVSYFDKRYFNQHQPGAGKQAPAQPTA
ncbi:hypothetical protein [Hymenobacter chitinivorans]|uniref:Uncharacterized protein n=1 Tax=Hymenobacter chitinivorans DSM 11115 TaxID=1121954 RepID=A0A2M9BSF2_9BACT|nr:hypothetical protein [Hymenobacter chitinivorans]PJJ60889.1 hypothetical protein CLV45_2324 [Hymenobacter chitinivorans DSM 11115]